ncbi:MAG TPA: hypothetical protein VFS76_25720 [Pyrinomonadaceae bacterium]|nr:hypothetical protein [Pyrinomonadaceae bacterium]
MKTPINYELAWREFLKRNLVFWGLFVGFVPGMVLISEVGRKYGVSEAFGFAGFAWMAAVIVAAIWRMSWKCPRCRKRFYYKWWYGNSFALKCVHCGFRPTKSG